MAVPGIMSKREEILSAIAVPPNTTSSTMVATTETKMVNKVHHQYSDRLDRVRKSKYLRNPDETACVKDICWSHTNFLNARSNIVTVPSGA